LVRQQVIDLKNLGIELEQANKIIWEILLLDDQNSNPSHEKKYFKNKVKYLFNSFKSQFDTLNKYKVKIL